ncbi:hypothetical protein ACTJIJ_08105 [Niabella sp. 22666]|uniref:hypothetical protein n=1 Tax=Niabella sp. 22666 TaxID=3453954 RepID=UPI003F870292
MPAPTILLPLTYGCRTGLDARLTGRAGMSVKKMTEVERQKMPAVRARDNLVTVSLCEASSGILAKRRSFLAKASLPIAIGMNFCSTFVSRQKWKKE